MAGITIYQHQEPKHVQAMITKLIEMECYSWGLMPISYFNVQKNMWELRISLEHEFEEMAINRALIGFFVENLMFFKV